MSGDHNKHQKSETAEFVCSTGLCHYKASEKPELWFNGKAMYSTPPKREWQGLTDAEIAEGQRQSWVTKSAWESAVWWAEAKLREKNYGQPKRNTDLCDND